MVMHTDQSRWTQTIPSPWGRTRICPMCGAEYTVENNRRWPWRIPGKRGIKGYPAALYCSRKCMREAEETSEWLDEQSRKPMEVD